MTKNNLFIKLFFVDLIHIFDKGLKKKGVVSSLKECLASEKIVLATIDPDVEEFMIFFATDSGKIFILLEGKIKLLRTSLLYTTFLTFYFFTAVETKALQTI